MSDFYFDHNVCAIIAAYLRRLGHSVVTADELGLGAATDDVHLLVAAERGAILVTHNKKDFELLHDAWRRWSAAWGVTPAHSGILTLKQLDRSWWPSVAQEIATFVEANPPLASMLYDWAPASGWQPRA